MTLILQGTDNSVSSPAVQGGTAGTTTGVYYPASNQVGIASGGTKAIIVAQSNVTNFYNSNNLRLYTANEGNYGFLRNSGASSSNSIELGANGVVIKVDDNYNATFYNSGAAQKTIITANNGIGIGGATPSSGTGITFPSAQDASSNTNTLDDYEEGSWTPILVNASGTVYRTAGTNCSYIKIGKQVTLIGQADFSNVSGAAGSNQVYIGGFPFAMGGDTGQSSMDCPIFIWNYTYANWQNNYYFSSSASVGDTKHPCFWHGQAGAIATDGNSLGGGTVYFNFQYTYLASN